MLRLDMNQSDFLDPLMMCKFGTKDATSLYEFTDLATISSILYTERDVTGWNSPIVPNTCLIRHDQT